MCYTDSNLKRTSSQLRGSVDARCSFSIVEGGKLRSVPRMLVVDVKGASSSELAALDRAAQIGMEIITLQGLRAEERAARLACACEEKNISLQEVAVIAIDACDLDPLLEAGTAFALESAGYDACMAADRVFAPRERGGLVAAINAVCDLAE